MAQHSFGGVFARLLGEARQRDKRGGIKPWKVVANEVRKHLSQDRACYVTLMVDYYAMPVSGDKGWPGREEANCLAHENKAPHIQNLLQIEVQKIAPGIAHRFIPYVQMHEFEALLFSDCKALAQGVYQPEIAEQLEKIRQQFGSPECINNSPETAPSKRLAKIIPQYDGQKPLLGTLGAKAVGLDVMRQQCPGFAAWLQRLEQLPALTHP